MPKPRLVFMGTPEFAVPSLQALANRDDVELVLAVTQPDRPAGRGKKLAPPPVKDAAQAAGIPVLQTDSLRHADVKQRIIAAQPDLIVVAAFGMILGKWILELPKLGCVNLHASLLPKYRGASPISAAILAGDDVTGVTLMQMDRGLDTGDMLASIEVPIQPDDTTESLTPKLAGAGAALLDRHLPALLRGEITPVPQPEGASETRQLTKEDGRIDWNQPAAVIERQVRAMWSWPRAFTELADSTRMQVHRSSVTADPETTPGQITVQGTTVVVATGEGGLLLERVQLPGGKPIEGHAIAQKLQPYT